VIVERGVLGAPELGQRREQRPDVERSTVAEPAGGRREREVERAEEALLHLQQHGERAVSVLRRVLQEVAREGDPGWMARHAERCPRDRVEYE